MTANEIITKCDRLKPNDYSYTVKFDWLKKVESDIIDYVNLYSDKKHASEFENSQNPVLFLDNKNENLYLYYLISMIDLSNQEYDLYSNNSAFFNHELSGWKKQVRQTNVPKCDISIKI